MVHVCGRCQCGEEAERRMLTVARIWPESAPGVSDRGRTAGVSDSKTRRTECVASTCRSTWQLYHRRLGFNRLPVRCSTHQVPSCSRDEHSGVGQVHTVCPGQVHTRCPGQDTLSVLARAGSGTSPGWSSTSTTTRANVHVLCPAARTFPK